MNDYDEIFTYSTDPTSADSDGDGLYDGHELNDYGTDPLVDDSSDYMYLDEMEYSSSSVISTYYTLGGSASSPSIDSSDYVYGSYSGVFPWSSSRSWWQSSTSYGLYDGPYSVSSLVGVTSGTPSQGNLGFWLKTDDYSALTDLQIQVGSSSSNYGYASVTLPTDNEWNYYSIPFTSLTINGTPAWTSVDFLRFTVNPSGSSSMNVDSVMVNDF